MAEQPRMDEDGHFPFGLAVVLGVMTWLLLISVGLLIWRLAF